MTITDDQVLAACRAEDWTFDCGTEGYKQRRMVEKRREMEAVGSRDSVSSATQHPANSPGNTAGERAHIETLMQAVREMDHAINVGPEWFTNGSAGMRGHVNVWFARASDAYKALTAPAVTPEHPEGSQTPMEQE